MEQALTELETALGHAFAKPVLLVCALTHRSLVNQQAIELGPEATASTSDNERLEFLGDAVLGLVVGEGLFLLHPEWQEGELTRVRAQLVSRQHMARVATAIGLGEYRPGTTPRTMAKLAQYCWQRHSQGWRNG